MKGLFQKDICILLQRKSALLIFLVIMVVMGFSAGTAFTVYYGAILFGFMAVSTIAYDDEGNNMSFLMTLPVTVKEYVVEKLLFGGAGLFIGWASGIILSIVFSVWKKTPFLEGENIIEMVAVLLLFESFLSLYVPIQLKFGVEKSRIVIISIGAIVFAIGTFFSKYENMLPTHNPVFSNLSDGTISAIILVVCILLISFAYKWSVQVLEKKEY